MWIDLDEPYNFSSYVIEVKGQGQGSKVNLVYFWP
jgi:hypothetical protein